MESQSSTIEGMYHKIVVTGNATDGTVFTPTTARPESPSALGIGPLPPFFPSMASPSVAERLSGTIEGSVKDPTR